MYSKSHAFFDVHCVNTCTLTTDSKRPLAECTSPVKSTQYLIAMITNMTSLRLDMLGLHLLPVLHPFHPVFHFLLPCFPLVHYFCAYSHPIKGNMGFLSQEFLNLMLSCRLIKEENSPNQEYISTSVAKYNHVF